MNKTTDEALTLEALDERVEALRERAEGDHPFPEILSEAEALVADLLRHYARLAKGEMLEEQDLLDLLRRFLKGDPSLNAVRDNVRELVYYRNCLKEGREDALPKAPGRMAARTAAHIHLYLRTRLEQEGLA